MPYTLTSTALTITSGTESTGTLIGNADIDALTDNNVIQLGTRTVAIEAGATFIADDEEGVIVTSGTITNRGTLFIGRFTDDFYGDTKQTTGVSVIHSATNNAVLNLASGSTYHHYSGLQINTSTQNAMNVMTGSTATFYGGGYTVRESIGLTGGAARWRVNGGSTVTLDGAVAGQTEREPFRCIGNVRFDVFTPLIVVRDGAYTAQYTSGGGYQVVAGAAVPLITFPGFGIQGLDNNWLGDAFGGSQVKILNPASAARYNATHRSGNQFNWTFLAQELQDRVIDTLGATLTNAYYHIEDTGADKVNGGTTDNDRVSAPPTSISYIGSTSTVDPVFGDTLNVSRYQSNIVYQGLVDGEARMDEEIATRLLIGGDSASATYASNGPTGDVRTHYRFTEDNNDTALVRVADYGKARLGYNVNLVGLSAPIRNDRVALDDAVVLATGRTRAQAISDLAVTGLDSIDRAISVIEINQTPTTNTDSAALFRYFANGDKSWSGLTSGNVVFRDLDVTLDTGANGISIGSNNITGPGMASVLTGGSLGLNLGSRTLDSNIENFNGTSIIATNINLTAVSGVSNVSVNGTTVFVANPNGGVSIEGSASGLTSVDGLTFVSNPTIALGSITNITAETFTGSFRFTGSGSVSIIEAQRVQLGLADQDSQTINGITYNRIVPVANVTLSPGVSETFLQANGGYWAVTDSTGTLVDSITTITGTTTLADVTFTRLSTVSDTFTGRYQPLSSLTGGDTFDYGEDTFTPDTTGSVSISPRQDTALTASTDVDRTSLVTIAASGSGSTYSISVTYDVTTSGTTTLSQELGLVVRNHISYLTAVIERGYDSTLPIFEFQQPFLTAFNGIVGTSLPTPFRNVYTLTPDDAAGGQVPLSGSIGYVTGRTATNNVAFFSPDIINVAATLGQVTAATDASQRIQDIDNKSSYLVTDNDGALAGGRLFGIKPKNADYNPGTTYTTNT